jgi:hypothetical protein
MRWTCREGALKVVTSVQAQAICWKVLVVLLLLSTVNFLKSLLAKLLSNHFYRTAHLAKIQDALDKVRWDLRHCLCCWCHELPQAADQCNAMIPVSLFYVSLMLDQFSNVTFKLHQIQSELTPQVIASNHAYWQASLG